MTELDKSGSALDRPIVIVVDGGPASGKSWLLEQLRRQFPKLIFVQEAATAVFGAGYPLPFAGVSSDLVETQLTIFNFQRGLERMALRQAEADKARIIILDRATLSGEAYMPGGPDQFYQLVAGAPKQTLAIQYDEVWVCRSLASFDEEAYEQIRLTNPHRSETAEQAAVMDERTRSVWRDHPGYVALPSEQGLEAMLALAVKRIQQRHLAEIERKWVLPGGSLAALRQSQPEVVLKTAQIDQGYLWTDSNTRLRRQDQSYYLTNKAGVGLERVEFDSAIPQAMFEELWPRTMDRRIVKERSYLEGSYEYDCYHGELEGLETVERSFVRTDDAHQFVLSDQLIALGAVEVTGQVKWGNHWLAVHGLPVE